MVGVGGWVRHFALGGRVCGSSEITMRLLHVLVAAVGVGECLVLPSPAQLSCRSVSKSSPLITCSEIGREKTPGIGGRDAASSK